MWKVLDELVTLDRGRGYLRDISDNFLNSKQLIRYIFTAKKHNSIENVNSYSTLGWVNKWPWSSVVQSLITGTIITLWVKADELPYYLTS